MNTDNYYIPTEDDFCVGLEYKDIRTPNLGYTYSLRSLSNLELENTRVKYLDKSDIESLGWKFFQSEVDFFELDFYRLHTFNGTGIVSIDKGYDQNGGYSNQVFRGDIKNKLELQKLMKQLNICKKD